MNTLVNRLYSDYAMPSRLPAHEEFIRAARDMGYAQTSVRAFYLSLLNKERDANQRAVVHRHDIDTDLRTARKLFEIEKKHGIRSTFYFRLSTLDFPFMREIEEYGSEASYHYEELATFAKKKRNKGGGANPPAAPRDPRQFYPELPLDRAAPRQENDDGRKSRRFRQPSPPAE